MIESRGIEAEKKIMRFGRDYKIEKLSGLGGRRRLYVPALFLYRDHRKRRKNATRKGIKLARSTKPRIRGP